MSANSFGEIFKIITFGESHGNGLGVVIDSCPAGIPFDQELLMTNLKRRRPGTNASVSQRNESDEVEILSGVYQGLTLGTPIAMLVRNQDARSTDYQEIEKSPRIGHADDVWKKKFGHVDPRGGGRASGRETVTRVMAGSVAQMLMKKFSAQTKVIGWSQNIGPFEISNEEKKKIDSRTVESSKIRFPSGRSSEVEKFLESAIQNGESFGGVAEILIQNPPENLGQPVFHKLKVDLAAAVMSVGATVAFEIGSGIESSRHQGTDFHDQMESPKYGGIRGGISTGEDISIRVHFKPTSSIKDIAKKGRHDPCIVPRAVPVLESMVWLVLADHLLWARLDR